MTRSLVTFGIQVRIRIKAYESFCAFKVGCLLWVFLTSSTTPDRICTFKKVYNIYKFYDVPRRASYGVYISQLIKFARVCNRVADFNALNKCLTAKLLQQGYRYHKLRKTFSKFYRRHYELISKFNVGLKIFLRECLSEPVFYGGLVHKLMKLIGRNDFSFQFRKKS